MRTPTRGGTVILLYALGAVFASGSAGAPEASAHARHNTRGLATARAAVVSGTPTFIAEAPWQVSVQSLIPEGTQVLQLRCGGSIVDVVHIVTAAHCVFNPQTAQPIAPQEIRVRAGTADLTSSEPGEIRREVASVRVHPYYDSNHGEATDDVAVLTLTEALAYGPGVSPVSVAAPGSVPAEGAAVALAGFGEQTPGTTADEHLYGLRMSLAYPRECGSERGEDSAVLLCASSPSGSPCSGDSGSGLVLPGTPATLLGVMDDVKVVKGAKCVIGALALFANVSAPEIQDFIDGSESPPEAPRGGGPSCDVSGSNVGDTMTCQTGNWTGSPEFTYRFIDSSNEHVSQSGSSPTHRFTQADVGGPVFVQVQASNAGGTGVDRTQPTPPITAAPPNVSGRHGASLASARLGVGGGRVHLRLSCTGSSRCRGRVTLTAWLRARGARRVTLASGRFSLPAGSTGSVALPLSAAGRRLLQAGTRRIAVRVALRQLAPASMRIQSACLTSRG